MPYRAMMWTLMTIGIALLIVAMWVRAVQPMAAEVVAENKMGMVETAGGKKVTAVQEMSLMVKGTLLLAFLLIGTLLVVGVLGAYREWMRYRGEGGRKRTKYVDAWKLAGERLKVKEAEEEE